MKKRILFILAAGVVATGVVFGLQQRDIARGGRDTIRSLSLHADTADKASLQNAADMLEWVIDRRVVGDTEVEQEALGLVEGLITMCEIYGETLDTQREMQAEAGRETRHIWDDGIAETQAKLDAERAKFGRKMMMLYFGK